MKPILIPLLLAVVGIGYLIATTPNTYIVHRYEVVDTVYADTLYDTTFVETYVFDKPLVNLIYGSHIEGGICLKTDSVDFMTVGMRVQNCEFTVESETIGYENRSKR